MASRIDYSQNRQLYVGTTAEVTVADGNAIIAGDVGIGTTSPSEKLEVTGNVILDASNARLKIKGGVTGTNSGIDWTFNSDTTSYAKLELDYDTRASTGLLIDSGYPMTLDYSSSRFAIQYNGAEQMRINSSGNVGIGTTSPGYKLQVGDNGVADGNIAMKANGTGVDAGAKLTFNMNVGGGNADSYIAQIVPISYDSLSSGTHNSLNFKVGTWNNNADAGVSRMTILSSGNVGIGTTNPGAKLDVSSDIRTATRYLISTGTTNENMAIGYWDGANARIEAGAALPMLITSYQGNIKLGINGGTTMTVQPTKVGIGTTSPLFKLQTNATITGSWLGYLNGTSATFGTNNFSAVHSSTAIGTGTESGINLANNASDDGAPSPIISFSAKSASANYQHAYAAIYGIKTATGADTNWNKGDLVFATGQGTGPNERMRINSAGNVGIGTTSPDGKLEIASNSSLSSYVTQYTNDADGAELVIRTARGTESTPIQYNTGDSAGRLLFQAYTSSGAFKDAASIESVMESGNANAYGGLRFNYLPAVSPYTLTEGIRLNMSGNVGIGETNPDVKLEVAGNIRATGQSLFLSTSSTFNKIALNGTDMEIWSGALFPSIDITNTGLLKFGAYALSGAGTPTKLLGVDSSGNVLTTVSGGDLPGGPYLPLSGGTLTGGLTGTTAAFSSLTDTFFPVAGTGGLLGNSILYKLNYNSIGLDTTARSFYGNNFHSISNSVALNLNAGLTSSVNLKGNGADILVASTGGNVNIPNGKLGIGMTTAPSTLLYIKGTGDAIRVESTNTGAGGAQLDLLHYSTSPADGDTMGYINMGGYYDTVPNQAYFASIKTIATDVSARQGALTFTTRNGSDFVEAMRIAADGNVGIGTTSPDEFLDIEGDADVYAKIQYTGNGSNTPADHAGLILSHGRSTWYLHNKYSAGSGVVGSFSIASSIGTNALTILSTNRNVGIGTDNPTAKLHVNGSDFKVTNGSEEAINVDLDNYVYKFGDISGGETQSFLEISSADSEAYFLNCDLGIGTSSPTVPLDVTGSDTGTAFNDGIARFANTTSVSSGGATVINIRNNYLGGFGTLIKFFRTSTSSSIANISFNTGGTAVNYNTGSDYRLKEDLKTFNGLDIINNISVYNYKWKGVDFRGYGVIAHELQPIFPDAVTGEKDAEEMQSVDYSKLVPVLIKSVQELKKEIELLKQQLNK